MTRLHIALFYISIGLLWFAGCSSSSRESKLLAPTEDAIESVKTKGPVKLVVRITPRNPRLSDLVKMEIETTAEPDVEIKPPTFGKAVGDFLVRDYSEKSDPHSTLNSSNSKKLKMRRFQYQLEPVQNGLHLIRSIAIEFIDNRLDSENRGNLSSIESDPIEVQITSELGDQVPNLADLAPMTPPRPVTQSSSWVWLAIGFPVAMIAIAMLWLRRRRKTPVATIVQKTPSEIAHAALTKLLSENLPGQQFFQEFYLRLTSIVRHYIEGTTGIHAPEQTTEEFLRAMHSRHLFQAEQSVRLQEFLEAADMVKYAGQQPQSDQIELSIGRAREFIDMRSLIAVSTSANGDR